MNKRGRKSAAELAITPVITVVPRPAAPDHLDDDEAECWENYVSGMAATYFGRAQLDTLSDLCRHTIAARNVSRWIARARECEDTTIADMDRLFRMRERETRAANALARSLRLTKQSQIGPRGAAARSALLVGAPWEAEAKAQCEADI